ncbi:MAG: LptF/LptG family permease [Nitrospirae bacterium]|nr:LptF/LptG family permease [Candidatus Troglogloeales bacterium]
MSILSRYILIEFLKLLLILLIALLTISSTIYFLERIRWFSEGQAPFFSVAQHFLLTLPKMISDLMPLALFLSSLLVIGTLSKNNEIIPIMSAGISMISLTTPILLIGAVISGIFFFLNGSFVPSTYKAARVIQKEKIEKMGVGGTLLQNKIWIRLNSKTVLYTRLVDPKKNRLIGVHFYYLGSKLPIETEMDANMLRFENGQWILSDGVQTDYEEDGTALRTPFVRKVVQIGKTLLELQQIEVKPDEMTYDQLQSYVDQLKKDGLNKTRYQVDLDRKYAFPLSNFILVLLGVGIAFQHSRQRAIAKSVLTGLAIFLLYWLSLSVTLSMGRLEMLSSVQASWGPHILFLFLGVYQFFQLHKVAG